MRRLLIALPLLALTAAPSPAPAETACLDDIFITVQGADVLIDHTGAWYNCCPEMRYDVTLVDGTIVVVETEVEGLCDCYCCFDLQTTVTGLAPGEWLLDFTWLDDASGVWETRSFAPTIPDLGQDLDLGKGDLVRGPCYDPSTGVPDRVPTWGAVKVIFD